jgi:hypothetical protein
MRRNKATLIIEYQFFVTENQSQNSRVLSEEEENESDS